MGLILSIETSTKVCSVALHKNNQPLALTEFFEDKSHSRVLTEQINYLLRYAGYDIKEIDAVAISKGPGSYTGLRIGVATAKGLCYALDKPLIAVNTLEAMCLNVNKINPERYDLCPMLDARRMEVYCCLMDASLSYLLPTQAKVIEENSFHPELARNKIFFFGNGSEKCIPLLGLQGNAIFIKDIYPSALHVGALAGKAFEKGIFEDTAYFEPYYLKEFLATQKK